MTRVRGLSGRGAISRCACADVLGAAHEVIRYTWVIPNKTHAAMHASANGNRFRRPRPAKLRGDTDFGSVVRGGDVGLLFIAVWDPHPSKDHH